MTKDIMIDLETLDNVGSSSILSIGAVACNIVTGEVFSNYYRVITLEGQQELGLTINADTLYWWLGQSDGARAALLADNKITLEEMCISFIKWLEFLGNPKRFRLWGNGASFDNAILRHAFRRCKLKFPIDFWNDRDMRTVVGYCPPSMVRQWKLDNPRIGTYHNALDDAKYQVKLCSYINSELGVKEIF